jgi:streptomycin 6-kinase
MGVERASAGTRSHGMPAIQEIPMTSPVVPDYFAQHMRELDPHGGAAWVTRLPDLVAELAARWGLDVGLPLDPLTYNWVASATRADGTRAILKLGLPGSDFRHELAALRHFDGHGIAQLLEADAERNAMLLERLEPGTTLDTLADDEEATRIAARVMRALWVPAPEGGNVPTAADWGCGFQRLRTRFDGGTGPLPRRMVEQAETLFQELLASQSASMLLHGDLHHMNILQAQRAPWLAIDPKGLVGEPAYETGALLRNPTPQVLDYPNPISMTERRIAILAEELGFERARIRSWGLAQAVLSAWWSIEDEGHGWEGAITMAGWLATLPE